MLRPFNQNYSTFTNLLNEGSSSKTVQRDFNLNPTKLTRNYNATTLDCTTETTIIQKQNTSRIADSSM